jgi:hypothetical protein
VLYIPANYLGTKAVGFIYPIADWGCDDITIVSYVLMATLMYAFNYGVARLTQWLKNYKE